MEPINNILASVLFAWNSFFNSSFKQVDVEFERPLICGLYHSKIKDNKVEVRNSFGHFFVEVTDSIELNSKVFEFLHFLADFKGLLFGVL